MISVNNSARNTDKKTAKKRKEKKNGNIRKGPPKKFENTKKNTRNKKKNKIANAATIHRRKLKKLKQKLREISKLKTIYNTNKSLLDHQQIEKVKQEQNIQSQIYELQSTKHSQTYNKIKNENKAMSHARRISHSLTFIAQQITAYSQQLNNYIESNNVRTVETYIGNIKHSLLTLYSRMNTLINELDCMQHIPLKYTDDPKRPSIYFKNECVNNEKHLAVKHLKKKYTKKNDDVGFFLNRFESFGVCHANILKMVACDGRINVSVFKKLAGDLISKHKWNDNELFFSCIQGIVPHSKIYSVNLADYLKKVEKLAYGYGQYAAQRRCKGFYRMKRTKMFHAMLHKMQCDKWVANQLEKISLLVHNGWDLDCKQKQNDVNMAMTGWSQLLWTMSSSPNQYYVRIICFIHDFMNGEINFLDQDGRSLAHFAASIFPLNMAYKLCIEMDKIGYDFGLKDIDGITPVNILYCNMLKSYENIIATNSNQEFQLISGKIIEWSLHSCGICKDLRLSDTIIHIIATYGHYDIERLKNKNWELQNLFMNKWIYSAIHENYWKIMLKKQKKRLNVERLDIENKLKLKNIQKENRINKEKKRLYLLENKAENDADFDDIKINESNSCNNCNKLDDEVDDQ